MPTHIKLFSQCPCTTNLFHNAHAQQTILTMPMHNKPFQNAHAQQTIHTMPTAQQTILKMPTAQQTILTMPTHNKSTDCSLNFTFFKTL